MPTKLNPKGRFRTIACFFVLVYNACLREDVFATDCWALLRGWLFQRLIADGLAPSMLSSGGMGPSFSDPSGVVLIGTLANASLASKFESLGVSNDELDALVQFLKHQPCVPAGTDIVHAEQSTEYSTLLLSGVACSYKRLEDGTRQIYSFQYPGDFCDLYRYVLPERDEALAVQALTDCSIATIGYAEIEQLMAQRPRLGLALWRSTMLEASILRQWLSNARRGLAVQRVANLLCEQLVRREASGIASPVVPVTQIDIADAAGLSIVHVNRTIQTLRNLKVLSKGSPGIKVVDRNQLSRIAGFDGRYLGRARAPLEVVRSVEARAPRASSAK